MKPPTHIEIPQVEIQIGDEKFTLREMPAKRLYEYAQIAEDLQFAEKSDPAPTETDRSAFEAWYDRQLVRSNAPLRFVLGRSDEWIEEHLVASAKRRILAIQRHLNDFGDIEGNGPAEAPPLG